ncbi:N-acetylmuramoyl-L-alanine amidase [Pseudonocardia sp. KRD291]|uniref:peptidoglycan recognition protein family protein n=1 Tax=Pseudonocardia sp. KRD291 TaxID=2792007 RepID=UPI001C4A6E03|nr:N-acetylmuramoyl-L-alanine amidase [Pseudonocardia sp. KRD291]MBW0106293.1 N-acetylmuramoyl-L-alanine amidase [Pseudonocardia sp. KRD291]
MDGARLTRRGVLAAGLAMGASSALAGPAWAGETARPAGGPPSTEGAPAPFIVSCPGWGARRPSSPVKIWDRRPIRILVHHTATGNGTDYSRPAADRLARAVQNYHMNNNGWLDSGQHFTISRGGVVLEGRSLSLGMLNEGRRQVEGAHCTGQNVIAVGIENEGIYTGVDPTPALWNSLRATCAYICSRYGIAPTELYGHRDYKNTACPGDRLYRMLPRLRAEVGATLGRRVSRTEAEKASWPLLRPGATGPDVTAAQYLLRDAGATKAKPTGRFDEGTADAVRTFQVAHGAEDVNGILGGESWPELARTVSRGPGRHGGDAWRAVDVLAEHRRVESVPDRVTAPVWQRLLGTGGTPVRPVTDPAGTARR